MQSRFNELEHLDATLKTGIDFELWYFTLEPMYFVIRKVYRSPKKVELLGLYYIIEGTIYQAPLVQQVLTNRLKSALHYFNKAVDIAGDSIRYHPSQGYYWESDEPMIKKSRKEMATFANKERLNPITFEDERIAVDFRQKVDLLLQTSFQDPKRKAES